MSGGYFNYENYRMNDIARAIEELIAHNDTSEYHGGYGPQTLERFQEAIDLIKRADHIVHRIDWLVSGDDSEESFHSRLNKQLEELNAPKKMS
jgi:hypothetical protein